MGVCACAHQPTDAIRSIGDRFVFPDPDHDPPFCGEPLIGVVVAVAIGLDLRPATIPRSSLATTHEVGKHARSSRRERSRA
jgi:hypothetical protein